MKRLTTSKEEIIYLLNKAVEKYRTQTGQQIVLNTNRKNYEGLAMVLSDISNQLPDKWQEWGTEEYPHPLHHKDNVYPYRKYDITGGQIKDALSGIVSNPRSFLVDACYIYLYGVGRSAFEKNPTDENLPVANGARAATENPADKKQLELENELQRLSRANQRHQRNNKRLVLLSVLLLIIIVAGFVLYNTQLQTLHTTQKDMSILPYQPTQAEIDSLEGVWLCYTGSPQARSSDPGRYHLVVSNVLDVKYKNGYFTFTRYGASFDHVGYMQFEAPWLVSIHSYVRNANGSIESPRHSLMRLDKEKDLLPVISASWNFDAGDRNSIIGIREVYIKQGKGGNINEVINTRDNVGCHCKIVQWNNQNNTRSYYLKNELLDSISIPGLQPLIDHNSIILRTPQQNLILDSVSASKNK